MSKWKLVVLIVLGVVLIGGAGTFVFLNRYKADTSIASGTSAPAQLSQTSGQVNLSNIVLPSAVVASDGFNRPVVNLFIGLYGSTSFGKSIDVYQGQTITLLWQPQYADVCLPGYDWTKDAATTYVRGGSASFKLDQLRTYTFMLSCSNKPPAGSTARPLTRETVTATVKPDFVNFSLQTLPDGTGAIPGTPESGYIAPDQKASWGVTTTSKSCYKFGDWSGPIDPLVDNKNGTYTHLSTASEMYDGSKMELNKTYAYGIRCEKHAGETMIGEIHVRAIDGKPVMFMDGKKSGTPAYGFSAFDVILKAGEKADLRLISRNATTCKGINWNVTWSNTGTGVFITKYESTVGPVTTSTNYGATCTNKYGTSSISLPVRVM